MIDALKILALAGGDWVIWLLLISSVVAGAVIIERAVVLRRELLWLDELRRRVLGRLADGDLDELAKEAAKVQGLAAGDLRAGLNAAGLGALAAEERMAAEGVLQRQGVERRLLILGTLGNNAPFVGLFGTVLGVIKAFHDLAASAGAGPEVVMAGLSEALIATAVGLFVAIPCVVAYNYFQKRVKDLLQGAESMNRLLLARLKSEGRGSHAGARK